MSEQPWIEWSGGDCPVARDAKVVTVLVRKEPSGPARWSVRGAPELSWGHTGGGDDIIAYCVVLG